MNASTLKCYELDESIKLNLAEERERETHTTRRVEKNRRAVGLLVDADDARKERQLSEV